MIEAVVSSLILAFVVISTALLMNTGLRQQKIGREYSQVQTDLREALARMTRTIRHGYGVINEPQSNKPRFDVNTTTTADQKSSATHLIVEVPLIVQSPELDAGSNLQVRFHVTSGTLYAQRSDEPAPGLSLLTGVQSITFNYFQSNTGASVAVDGTPQQASAVQIRVTAVRGSAVTPVDTLVTMRNSILGL